MKKTILFIALATLCFFLSARGQNTSPPGTYILQGRITTATGMPLAGATIQLANTKTVTLADTSGLFQLVSTHPKVTLTITYTGYDRQQVSLKLPLKTPLLIRMTSSVREMQEVLVSTGYQTIPKERSTGSFAQVGNQLFNRRTGPNVLDRLEGVVPGLLFNHNTFGASNGSTDISIRGTSTLYGQSQPLIVVDGFPYEGDLNNINPNDVENISILKDAAAASIWGVKSGNGVIVITTKHGSRNKNMAIDFNANVTSGNKPDVYYSRNFLNSGEYIDIEKRAFQAGAYDNALASGYSAVSPVVALLARERAGEISSGEATGLIEQLKNHDVRDDISNNLYRRSLNQQYAIGIRGGGAYHDYSFSGGYDHHLDGQVGDHYERITLGSLNTFYPSKRLTVSAAIYYIRNRSVNNSPIANINGGQGTGGIYPYARLIDSRGNPLAIVKDYAAAYTDTAGQGRFYDWKYRPLDESRNADHAGTGSHTRIAFSSKYDLGKGLNAEIRYQYEKQKNENNTYNSITSYYTRNLINQFTQGYPAGSLIYPIPQEGILQTGTGDLAAQHGRLQLNYSQTFHDLHQVSVIAGTEVNQTKTATSSNTIYGYNQETLTSQVADLVTYFPVSPSQNYLTVPTTLAINQYTNRYLSYFANGGYTFRGRYSASVSGRIDQSNLFGVNTNQKSVPLYSAGLSWLFSEEPFYTNKFLTYGKLRATYGYNGNIDKNITAVTTIQQISGSSNPYSGTPFSLIANPGNPALRWEKVRVINLGLDFGLLDNRISGSFEYYLKKGSDLFGDSPLAPSTGLSVFRGNTADITGHGIDLMLNAKIISAANFSWQSNFLLSYALDKVTKYDILSGPSTYLNLGSGNTGTIFPLTGRPLYAIYSYAWAGLTHDTGDPQGLVNGAPSTDYAAIISQATPQNLKYNGPARPTTFGSFRNTFNYKAFSFSFNVMYKFNYYFRRSSVSSAAQVIAWTGHSDYSHAWKQPGDEQHTTVPAIQFPPIHDNRDYFYQSSAALVEKGDHIRLQDLSLSYNLSREKLPALPFQSIQLYGYINNVALLWRANKQGIDPDVYAQGYSTAIPLPTTYSLGIKANL